MKMLPGDVERMPLRRGTYSKNSIVDFTKELCLKAKQHHVAVISQHVLGICLAAWLLAHQAVCVEGILQAAAYIRQHFVENQVKWLMGAPAGKDLLHWGCDLLLELQHPSRSRFSSHRTERQCWCCMAVRIHRTSLHHTCMPCFCHALVTEICCCHLETSFGYCNWHCWSLGLKLHMELSQFLGHVGLFFLSYSSSAYSFLSRPVIAAILGMAPE